MPPRRRAEAEALPCGPASRPERARRILVVDDNLDALQGLKRLLERLGHEIYTAPDGPSALAEARAHRPGVVILDIGLPGMSGYDVADTLRREAAEGVVLIAVSGYAQDKDRERSRAAGFDRHLAKPVDLEELREIIDAAG